MSDTNPARAYLASLTKERTHNTMEQSLSVIAHVILYGDTPLGDSPNLPRSQRQVLRDDLCQLIDQVDWKSIDVQCARRVSDHLRAHYSQASFNKTISAMRMVLRMAIQMITDECNAEQRDAASEEEKLRRIALTYSRRTALDNAISTLVTMAVTSKPNRVFSESEIASILATCQDGTRMGLRDAALLSLLLDGVHRGELVALDLSDYSPATGELHIRRGIGIQRRLTSLSKQSQMALNNWIDARGLDPGPLFIRFKKGGALCLGKQITPQGVFEIVRKRARQAGLHHANPSDMRRTFVHNLMREWSKPNKAMRRLGRKGFKVHD